MSRSLVIRSLLDVAFPPCCAACGRSTVQLEGVDRGFCHECREDLVLFQDKLCHRCSTPLADPEADSTDCPVCREERWAFDETLALGPYDGLLRHLVLLAKRQSGAAGAVALGELLAVRHTERLASLGNAVVVPVPSHWSRRAMRMADGVGKLAEGLADRAGLPRRSLLRRKRATTKQTEVAPSDRRANVSGAFTVARRARLAGRTVLLVDDVLTTGSTCHAAAAALKRAGADRVVAVVAARRVGRL